MDLLTLNFSRQTTVSPSIKAEKNLQRRDRKENTKSVAQVLGCRFDLTSPFLRNRTESRVRHKSLSSHDRAAESHDQQNEEFRPKICSADKRDAGADLSLTGSVRIVCVAAGEHGTLHWFVDHSMLNVSGLSRVSARRFEVALSDSVRSLNDQRDKRDTK